VVVLPRHGGPASPPTAMFGTPDRRATETSRRDEGRQLWIELNLARERAGSRRPHAAGCWPEVRHHGCLNSSEPKAQRPRKRQNNRPRGRSRTATRDYPARRARSTREQSGGSGVYPRRSCRDPKVGESQICLHSADQLVLTRLLGGVIVALSLASAPRGFPAKMDLRRGSIVGLRGALAVRGVLTDRVIVSRDLICSVNKGNGTSSI
jgi:hypothetical protein